MINPNLLTDDLASQIADDYIRSYCHSEIIPQLSEYIKKSWAEAFIEYLRDEYTEKPQPNKEFFDALFKALVPYERKFTKMIRGIWEEERRIILANLKKVKKAYLSKASSDVVDNIMYPSRVFEGKLSKEAKEIYLAVMDKQGNAEMARIGVTDVAFDIMNPEIQTWLKSYVMKFAKNLEKTSGEKLRKALMEGLAEGESIPEITKRVNEIFKGWSKYRSKVVSRTETLRASNRANLFSYKMAKIKKKAWLAYIDKRSCPHCEMMDGKIIGIEENFWELGDESVIDLGEGKTSKLEFNYEAVESPPAHCLCRCSIVPVVD